MVVSKDKEMGRMECRPVAGREKTCVGDAYMTVF